MAYKFNPLTGKLDDYGPVLTGTGTVSAAADGTAALPGIAFTNDLNTGIYRPGADQVAISTGGTGRLFVDASGLVGVGTSSPGYLIHLGGSTAAAANGQIALGNISGTPSARIDGFRPDGTFSGQFHLYTTTSAGTQTRAVTIDQQQRVGIGTTAPTRNFVLNGTGVTYLKIAESSLGEAVTDGFDLMLDSSATAYVWNRENGPVAFGSNNLERLRITSTGDLNFKGAGTAGVTQAVSFSGSAPVNSLVVDASGNVGIGQSSITAVFGKTINATGPGGATYRVAGTSTSAYLFTSDGLGYGGFLQETNHPLILGTNSQERLRITSAGLVGIGTPSPLFPLDVNGVIYTRGRGSTFGVLFDDWRIYNSTAPGALVFDNGSERARIDSSGRLLIGTSSSESSFATNVQIVGTTEATSSQLNLRYSNNADGAFVYLGKSRGATVGTNTIVQANDSLGTIGFYGATGSTYHPGALISAAVDAEPGTAGDATDMPGRLVFSVTADGASSSTERFRITNDGVRGYNQPAPAAVDTTATLTVANLKTGIITSSTAAAVTMTLPTGTLTEGGFSGLYNNFTFEWTVINTGATNAVTVQGGTDHTLVGSGTVAAGVSGRFASRRTAANTFVTYRLS